MITGASDGIGKEFALQLARKGLNILLISRTRSKLEDLAHDIAAAHKVDTRIIAMDFSANQDSDYAKIEDMVSSLDVAILVNNVGLSHSIPVTFVDTQEKEMRDIITVNCIGTLRVTKIVAPKLTQRRKGLILTMASFGGITPTPLLATYSGSKAFLQTWSSALASELRPYNVKVQCVQSYLVTSAMSKIKRPSALIPTPKQFVKAALGKVGREGGAQGVANTSTPYWSHGFVHWGMITFLGTMNNYLIEYNRGMHEAIRKRALRKAERDAKKA